MTQPELDLKGREPRELLIEIRGRRGAPANYSEPAAYGEPIVATLSRQLAAEYGRGYTEKNLRQMIQFAEAFPEEEIEAGAQMASVPNVHEQGTRMGNWPTREQLCRKAGGDLEQIKFLLGHSSIQTTERYIGSEQKLAVAVNDGLGF